MGDVGLILVPAGTTVGGVGQLGLDFVPDLAMAAPPARVFTASLDLGDVPHLSWPLRLASSGAFAVVAQDSLPDVQQCVHVLLRTPLGARDLAPNVGVPDPTFTQGIDPSALTARLMDESSGEPRAEVSITAPPPDATGYQAVQIKVRLAEQDNAGADPDLEETT